MPINDNKLHSINSELLEIAQRLEQLLSMYMTRKGTGFVGEDLKYVNETYVFASEIFAMSKVLLDATKI